MPTYTAITLDRLMEPGLTKPMAAVQKDNDPKLGRWKTTSSSMVDRNSSVPGSKLYRAVSVPNSESQVKKSTATGTGERNHHWTIRSPALYATPEPTPLPDSPSSYPPSPYIVNHKRRGPRLLKSSSEVDVAVRDRPPNGNKLNKETKDEELGGSSSNSTGTSAPVLAVECPRDDGITPSVPRHGKEELVNGTSDEEIRMNNLVGGLPAQNGTLKSVDFSLQGDEADDFFDPQESMSVMSSTESCSNSGVERSVNSATPVAEFYDAWEDLSSEYGPQPALPDIEAELREIRTSLLMEIEKRKQAEEALSNMQARWQKIREQLLAAGLTLPCNLAGLEYDQQNDPAEELSLKLYLARFVSNSIGRATAKAEIQMEMEAQIDSKNFEITRLMDRLRYYEAVNREMSQRNQETVETARRLRQRRKRIKRWVWGSIAGTITVGAAVLAWSYFPSGKGSSSTTRSHAPEGECASDQRSLV